MNSPRNTFVGKEGRRRAWKLTVGSDKKEACAAKYAIILSLNGTVLNEGSFFVKNEYFSHRMKEMDSILESFPPPPLLRLEFKRTHHLCFDFNCGLQEISDSCTLSNWTGNLCNCCTCSYLYIFILNSLVSMLKINQVFF